MSHYYVYRFERGAYLFDRTCGTAAAATERVRDLGPGSVFLVDHLIAKAFC